MPPQSVAFQATSQTLLQIMQPGQGLLRACVSTVVHLGVDQVNRLFEDINDGLNRAARAPGPRDVPGLEILLESRGSVSPRPFSPCSPDTIPSNIHCYPRTPVRWG